MSITPTRTVILAQYKRGASITIFERIMSRYGGECYRVRQSDEYRSIDKAKAAYLARVPNSSKSEQERMIKNGLRFADERQVAHGGENVNTKAGTGKRNGGASTSRKRKEE